MNSLWRHPPFSHSVTYHTEWMLHAGEAELVFCPYNYIIDPVIRAAMDVDISNAVLIFDEAHNIEDSEPPVPAPL